MARHVKSLDSMRAISAFVVLASHLVQIFWLPIIGLGNPLHRLSSVLSETAVIVFFQLSGYLVTMSICRNVDRHATFNVSDYAAARVARIYPPLICAIVLSAAIYHLIAVAGLPGVSSALRHPDDVYAAREILTLEPSEILLSLQMRGGLLVMNGPLWSLYIEVALYATAGAAALMLKGSSMLRRTAGAICALVLCAVLVRRGYTFYALWWLMGSAFLLCQLQGGHRSILGPVLVGLAGSILLLSPAGPAVELPRLGLLIALSFLMFFRWQWECRPLEWAAGISYTLYLVHFPILLLCYSMFLAQQSGVSSPSTAGRFLATFAGAGAAVLGAWLIGRQAERTSFFKGAMLRLFRWMGMGPSGS